jgi:hypothetical protein
VGHFQTSQRKGQVPAKAQRRKESIQDKEALNSFAPLRLCGRFFPDAGWHLNFKLTHYQEPHTKID